MTVGILLSFTSRDINYDDVMYFKAADHIVENGTKSMLETEMEFLGKSYRYQDGTHSLLFPACLAVLRKAGLNLPAIHIIIYILYALTVFPIGYMLARYRVKYSVAALMMIMFNPLVLVNANTFMTDIPGYAASIAALAFFMKYNDSKKYVFAVLSVILAFAGMMISYIYGYVFFLFILFAFLEKNRKTLIISGLSAASALIIFMLLVILKWTPSPFQAMSWPGSETLFNYHNTGQKFMSLATLLGFAGIALLFDRNTYKDYMLIGIMALGFIFSAFVSGYPPISRMILILLSVNGIYVIYRAFYSGHEHMFLYAWYAVFVIAGVIIFPMIVSRYLLLAFLPVLMMLSIGLSKKAITAAVIINILLSIIMLMGDMRGTNAYYSLNAEDTGKTYYTGEWAFRNHMEASGAGMLMNDDTILQDGSLIFIPDLEVPSEINRKLLTHLEGEGTDSIMPCITQLLSEKSKAGFQTSEYGMLPFAFTTDYSIKVSRVRYHADENALMAQYSDRIRLWLDKPVIPLDVPDTLTFEVSGNFEIIVDFFPSPAARLSDGILVQLMQDSIVIDQFTAYPESVNVFYHTGNAGIITITADTLNNSNFDWAGIYVKEND